MQGQTTGAAPTRSLDPNRLTLMSGRYAVHVSGMTGWLHCTRAYEGWALGCWFCGLQMVSGRAGPALRTRRRPRRDTAQAGAGVRSRTIGGTPRGGRRDLLWVGAEDAISTTSSNVLPGTSTAEAIAVATEGVGAARNSPLSPGVGEGRRIRARWPLAHMFAPWRMAPRPCADAGSGLRLRHRKRFT
jgi:hypothetical protein